MAGQPMEVLTGGAGYARTTQQVAPSNANGATLLGLNAGLDAHHSVVVLVLFAVLVLFLLDRAGFRFAVTAGKR